MLEQQVQDVRNGATTTASDDFRLRSLVGRCVQASYFRNRIRRPSVHASLAELPKDRPILAYCRGPYCLMWGDAVQLLQAQGYTAFQMREGVAEWAATSSAELLSKA